MKDSIKNYIRVTDTYFKKIKKPDRYGIIRDELKKWKKEEIAQDFGRSRLDEIVHYDDFVIVPDNKNFKTEIAGNYNLYKPFSHKAKEGDWKWTKILLEHIFEEQYKIGMIYLQVLYLYPQQALPVLALVSRIRSTGKSTFLDWLTTLFGQNMVIIDAKNIKSEFNAVYATSNIIGIEETFIDKSGTIEKIKSLSTQKTMTVNMKMIQHFTLPFFGKIIMNSNNERKFIKIDQEEIRFFVRKLSLPKHENHNILNDMINEISAFLYHLESMPTPDFSKSRMVFTPEELMNESLRGVKEESKVQLYQELKDLFKDFFANERQTGEMLVTPIDIKNKWFSRNNNANTPYIKKVLIEDFGFERVEKNQRYQPFFSDLGKVGIPYIINSERFIKDHVENDGLPF